MPRVRISGNSIFLKSLEPEPEFWSKCCGRQLVVIALVALYTPDDSDRIELHYKHRKKLPRFLNACADGELLPCRNRAQEIISQLCPKSTRLYLYVPMRKSDCPTHYTSLVRDKESGLWRVRTPRIHEITSIDGLPPRDGIMAYWDSEYTPSPDITCGLTTHFRRILTGGQGIREMVAEVQESRELRRQMTHCALVSELLGCLMDRRIAVRFSPGKIVFRISELDMHGNFSPYTTPYTFEPAMIKPYARRVTKPSVIIWGNASTESLYVSQHPRSVQPQIRHAQEYAPEGKAYQFIKDILLSRLLPVIGLGYKDKVDILGISYDPDEQRTIVTDYALRRKASAFTAIPQFYLTNENRLWVPNHTAVEVLKSLYIESEPADHLEQKAYEERRYWLERVFKWLGASSPKDYPGLFEFWGRPLHYEKPKW